MKDNFFVPGAATTAGSLVLANFAPWNFTSTVSHRLANRGAVLFAKTNMDEFGMGSANANSAYGAVVNPFAGTTRGTHPRMGKQSRPQENIQSWDKSFLAGRARDFQNSHSNGKTTAAVSEYFPLHKVVRGAGELLEKVFGVWFELTDVPANEKWCHEAQKVRGFPTEHVPPSAIAQPVPSL